MKKIVLILMLGFGFSASGQLTGWVPYASKNKHIGLAADSLMYMPVKDTTHTPQRLGAYTMRPQDSCVYVGISQTAGTQRWAKLAKYSDGTSWSLTGNSGTVAGTNFIGTTDNVGLMFKTNNVQSGLISGDNTSIGYESLLNNSGGFQNVAFGYGALKSATFPIGNVAIGYNALNLNLTGGSNVAVGIDALKNNTASGNVAVGNSSLKTNTSGSGNTAIGQAALQLNLTGTQNTAVGVSAGYGLTKGGNSAFGFNALSNAADTGFNNVAIGGFSLLDNISGSNNVAVGVNALLVNTTGEKNTAIGAGAMENNTTGSFNTAVGQDALLNNVSGFRNIGIGWNAKSGDSSYHNIMMGYETGPSLTTGNHDNIFIAGFQGGYHASQKTDVRHSIALGTGAYTTANNQFTIGDSLTRLTFPGISRGTANYVLTDSLGTGQYWVARPVGAASSVPLSGITAATGTNSINNGNHPQTWSWNTLDGVGLFLTSSSTVATGGTVLFGAQMTGAHSTSGITSTALDISNLHSGTTSINVGISSSAQSGTTNIAGKFEALSGTNNYAIIVPSGGGNVGIGTSTPTSLLHVVPVHTTGIGVAVASSTTTSGSIMDITGTSTALAANNEGLNIGISGANGTNGITATGARISVTNTNATSGTNVALELTASGATTANYALITGGGNVGIGTSTPDSLLHNAGSFHQVGNAKFDAKIHAPNLVAGNGTKAVRWDATNGFVLADTVASGITIGSTAITGGTDTRVLFNDGGVVGEDAGMTYVKSSDSLVVGQITITKPDNYGTDIGIVQIIRDNLNATNNVRGYYDGTRFSTAAGQMTAYASFDSYVNCYPAVGRINGHVVSFQSRPKQYSAGTTQRVVDFGAANADLASGKWGTKIGFEYYNVVKGGGATLDSQYAIYIHGLSAAGMQNRGIFEEDGVSNIFGGETFVKGVLQVNNVIAPGVSKITMGGDNPSHTSRIAFYEGVTGNNMYGIGMANPSAGNYGVAVWANASPPGATNMLTFVDLGGNFLVGGSLAGTSAAKSIQLFNGTAPSANISGVQITSVSGELQARSSSGEVSLLTGTKSSRVTTQYDNTTTTLGNINGLTSNVAAGKTYRFEAKLYTTSNVAGGIKVAIGGTATATSIIYEGITTDAGLITQSRATAMGTAVGAVTAVTAAYVVITGTITVNTAGTLTCQAAANVATGTTSVLVGSTFVLTEIL